MTFLLNKNFHKRFFLKAWSIRLWECVMYGKNCYILLYFMQFFKEKARYIFLIWLRSLQSSKLCCAILSCSLHLFNSVLYTSILFLCLPSFALSSFCDHFNFFFIDHVDLLPAFLEQCSCESWFRAVSSAIRSTAHSTDASVLEKISVLLQKLSKIK